MEMLIFAENLMSMEVNMIVAAGRDGAIGRNSNLIWRISADLRRFKSLTIGHPVIMGRKTWESLPKRPLPARRNIVVSRNPEFTAPGAEVVASPEKALATVTGESPFIMGGAELYNAFMPLVTRIFLTEIDEVCDNADAHIPFPLNTDEWEIEDKGEMETTPDGIAYRYVTYIRK